MSTSALGQQFARERDCYDAPISVRTIRSFGMNILCPPAIGHKIDALSVVLRVKNDLLALGVH